MLVDASSAVGIAAKQILLSGGRYPFRILHYATTHITSFKFLARPQVSGHSIRSHCRSPKSCRVAPSQIPLPSFPIATRSTSVARLHSSSQGAASLSSSDRTNTTSPPHSYTRGSNTSARPRSPPGAAQREYTSSWPPCSGRAHPAAYRPRPPSERSGP